MSLGVLEQRLLVFVGAGGVGKTTLAAATGMVSAREGARTLVMTFDPSLRLKDALGVGEEAKERPVRVPGVKGQLEVALLDARQTFDRLIRRHAPSAAAAERIYQNRFYRDLAGTLAGILEYMAVERLFEVQAEGKYDRVILDTPPTRQALDFLEAPDRIVGFLDSGAVKIALAPWWEEDGGLVTLPLRLAAKGAEGIADRLFGVRLLRDVVEFFRAFAPLYDGFRARATEVRKLLRAKDTLFVLVSGPGEDRIPDTMFFARKLREGGHRLGPLVVNQVHPAFSEVGGSPAAFGAGLELFRFLGERDAHGLARMQSLVGKGESLVSLPLQAAPPSDLAGLEALGRLLTEQLD